MAAQPPAEPSSGSDPVVGDGAGRPGPAFLHFRDGTAHEQVFPLEPASAPASVGRAAPADVLLDWDDQVSRRHARFEHVAGGWALVDDGPSRNGTFINEQRLDGSRRLSDGDVVRFGNTEVTFRLPEAHAPAAPEASRAPDPSRAPEPAVALSSTQRRVLAALCRPHRGARASASPAGDQQIADELFLSVVEVKTHLRVVCAKLGIDPGQEGARVRLAEQALASGLVSEQDE
jgi:predicted component of type VI protein secretion system